MSNALNLLVKFTGVDKLSGAISTITNASKGAKLSVSALHQEARELKKQIKDVGGELARSSGNTTNLINKENRLEAELAAVNRRLDQQKDKLARTAAVQARFGKVAELSGKAGAAMSVAVTAPLLAFAGASIQASRDSSAAIAQVQASLTSMGPKAGRSLDQLKVRATDLMNTSLFDDDEILRNVTANMLTFGKVTGTTFDRAQQAAVNMSAKLSTDLQGSSLQVGKALNDPVKGITALTRSGVSFTEQQKDMVKAMVAAGNTAGAQNLILSEMEKQFGGSAAAARKADPGGVLATSFGEFQQTIGDKLVPKLTPLVEKVTELIDKFSGLPGPVQDAALAGGAILIIAGPLLLGFAGIVSAIGAVVAIAPALGAAFTIMTGPIGMFIGIIVLMGALIYANWDKIKTAFSTGWEWCKSVLSAAPAWLSNLGSMMMSGLLAMIDPFGLRNRLLDVAKNGIAAFKSFFGIKSPSRLMMEMGGHMSAGLGMGIDKTSGKPLRAMGKMASAVAGAGALAISAPSYASAAPGITDARGSAASTARAGSQAAPGPITFNIYQLPGEDQQALAERVARLVEQAQRGKARRIFEDDQ